MIPMMGASLYSELRISVRHVVQDLIKIRCLMNYKRNG